MVLTIKAADIFWNLRLPHRVHASLAMLCWYSWDFLRYIEKNTLGGKKKKVFSNNPSNIFHITMLATFWSEIINIVSFNDAGRAVYTSFPCLNSFAVPPFCKFYEINHNQDPHVWDGGPCCGYALAIVEKIVNWCQHVLCSTDFVTIS